MHDQTRIIDLSLDLLREILNQKSHKQLEYMSALATPSRRERSLGPAFPPRFTINPTSSKKKGLLEDLIISHVLVQYKPSSSTWLLLGSPE